jgi:hypothetical protein
MTKLWLRVAVVLTLVILLTGLASPAFAAKPTEYDPSACASDTTGKTLSKSCAEMIAAFPKPDFERVEQDKFTLSAYSFWRVGPSEINLYDAPNGNVVGQIAKGYNFVNAIDLSVEGWLQIQGGKWVNRKDATYDDPSFFTGVKSDEGLKHDFAWVLDKSNIYASEVPGGAPSAATQRVLRRYELVYLYAEAKDKDGWIWYMIGPNQWVKQTFLARAHQVPEIPEDVKGRWVAVDLYEQTLIAYEDETPVFATLISSGTPPNETNEGLFKVWAKLPRDSMSGATGAPTAYALQSVPWVMYFDESISLHGTYWHDIFGYRTSHGCVNMTISDARFVFEWFDGAKPDKDGKVINYVYVYSSGKYGSGVIRQ